MVQAKAEVAAQPEPPVTPPGSPANEMADAEPPPLIDIPGAPATLPSVLCFDLCVAPVKPDVWEHFLV